MTQKAFTCFKAYDIRGEINVDIDENVAYCIGRAVAQHFDSDSVVVGFDAREASPSFAKAVVRGVCDAGSDVITIGMVGTEEMCWAVTELGASAGIQVTASHNPINYNGMKIVKSGSRPLDDTDDFQVIKMLAGSADWSVGLRSGQVVDKSVEAHAKYVDQVLSFVDVDVLRPLKVVVNSGNGAAGPTFDAIAARLAGLGAPLDFIRVHHDPDHTFPNGIPNSLLGLRESCSFCLLILKESIARLILDGKVELVVSTNFLEKKPKTSHKNNVAFGLWPIYMFKKNILFCKSSHLTN